jgi:hypothetical protein
MEWFLFCLLGSAEGVVGWEITHANPVASSQAMRSFRPIFQIFLFVLIFVTISIVIFGCIDGKWMSAIFGTLIGHFLGTMLLINLIRIVPVISKSDILRVALAVSMAVVSAIAIIRM